MGLYSFGPRPRGTLPTLVYQRVGRTKFAANLAAGRKFLPESNQSSGKAAGLCNWQV